MAQRIDWKSLQADFAQAHGETGISVRDWCEKNGLNYQSARRYIKPRTAQSEEQTAQSKLRSAQRNAQSEVRNGQSAQTKGNGSKANKIRRGGRSSASTRAQADKRQDVKNKGRDESGRFVRGEYEGNPNPPSNILPGMQLAKTHGGYAKFLDSPELFDEARELQLRDELDFTRARVISVTGLLKGLQQDLVTASEMTDRIALYDKILKAEQALDRNIQRIESIERTLSALRIDGVNAPKIEADTKRIQAATRKLTAEADLLEKDGGADMTPVAEMVAELQGLGAGGLMS